MEDLDELLLFQRLLAWLFEPEQPPLTELCRSAVQPLGPEAENRRHVLAWSRRGALALSHPTGATSLPFRERYNSAAMKITENSLNYLEEHIPELADVAIKQAYWQALASGSSVLEARDGVLVEPD